MSYKQVLCAHLTVLRIILLNCGVSWADSRGCNTESWWFYCLYFISRVLAGSGLMFFIMAPGKIRTVRTAFYDIKELEICPILFSLDLLMICDPVQTDTEPAAARMRGLCFLMVTFLLKQKLNFIFVSYNVHDYWRYILYLFC